MIRLKSQKFFSCDECGGGSTPVCDPSYLTLATSARGRILGVTLGSECQTFISGEGPGFIFYGADGQGYVEDSPALTLPYFNPAVSSLYPEPGGFASILIANGPNPASWYFLHAPSEDEWVVSVEGGQFVLKPPGAAAAQTAVCYASNFVTKGNLVICKQGADDDDGNPTFSLKKLAVLHTKVVVGDVDGGTGEIGYKALTAAETLMHELAKFDDLLAGEYRQYAVGGATETGGMNVAVVFGGGTPTTDAEPAFYSPTTHRFYRGAARTKESVPNPSPIVVADNGTFVSMSGHALFAGKTFNYPDFFISAMIRLGQTDDDFTDVDFGLFIDGTLAYTWDVHGGTDNMLTHLYKGLALGVHTVEIRFKQTAKSGAMTVIESNSDLFSVV